MDFNSLLLSIGDKLPKDGVSTITLKDKFERLSEDRQKQVIAQLPMIKLKSPALVFWVGTFLFGGLGVGRFMIGDLILGFMRLAITAIALICGSLMFEYSALGIIYGLLGFINWIWWIVDMFLVGKKLRKQNFEKINKIIEEA
ncbi:hypothetical protein JG676_05340 [Campylobacter sp. 2018MI35]|uniref:hypothetical protein n=1 Tax=unclassified Campylobacter TaxID=2593542 RepID=UPI00190715BF|nr:MULTISPECIES: hypothetical protein [unclassified Campylobacter]MBK1972235.1 hypothetical protein [Campylobacter sp. TTU_617]MBK1992022.1 hypothetical protein [Campylobacter sp. 2018MI34]